MVSLKPHFTFLLQSLPSAPAEQRKLDKCVEDALIASKNACSSENRKFQWEYLLKDDIFQLACMEGMQLKKDPTKYYDNLRLKLDLILTFAEHDACEVSFPLTILQDLLETQTITSCSQIFSWIEARAPRLTKDMIPQKGKALILLRTLNDLLRRLSKMGTNTIFCGRILTFLSGVFPLGERSGVNLRGEYGPTWEGVGYADKIRQVGDDKGQHTNEAAGNAEEDDKMQVDEKQDSAQSPEEKREEFYNTFWALQLPFSKPPIFANKDTFPQFKEALNKVMPVIKEATAKERAMMGSKIGSIGMSGALKRKREPSAVEESNSNEYFFAKFLTSPDLLDLEIADTHFRRQFLFQLLILLNHLLWFTASAKATWTSPRNRSLQMDLTLEESDAHWVQESIHKVFEELRQTAPNGRVFADTVHAILERERNWVKWKNELCTPFDKDPSITVVEGRVIDLFEATRGWRESMRQPPEEWKWSLGTEALTEIWEMGYRSLQDLENIFDPGDVKTFVKKIKLEDSRIDLRKKQLERFALARKQAAAAQDTVSQLQAPTIVVSTETTVVKTDASENSIESANAGLIAPRPATATNNSLLHPSLPPKPGSPAKTAPSLQELAKTDTVTPSATPTPSIPAPASTATPALVSALAPPPIIVDSEIAKYEENKQRWAWLALRAARDLHLQHFGKIGTGDIEALSQEIEKEEKIAKGDDNLNGSTAEDTATDSPSLLGTESYSESITKDMET